MVAAGQAAGEPRIVGAHRARAHQHGIRDVAQSMREAARRGTGDPARVAARGCDAAVERDGELERDERPAAEHVRTIAGGQEPRLVRTRPDHDRDARAPELRDAAAAHAGVGIDHGHDDAPEPEADERVRAGRRAPVVRARLEGDVERGAAHPPAGGAQGLDLGVRRAGAAVEALADDAPAAREDGAHRRVREGAPEALGRQRERARHEARVGPSAHDARRRRRRAAARRRGFPRRSAIRSSSSRMNSCTSRNERYTEAKRT